jgi:hypothetical protein
MLATELVTKLTDLIHEHGNLPVMNEYGHEIDEPEFNDDDGACILISFDEA